MIGGNAFVEKKTLCRQKALPYLVYFQNESPRRAINIFRRGAQTRIVPDRRSLLVIVFDKRESYAGKHGTRQRHDTQKLPESAVHDNVWDTEPKA